MRYKIKEFFYISNLLSLSRIVLVVPIVYLIALDTPEYNLLILGLIFIAALTDILDGYASRKLNIVTDLGIVLDPIADKITMAIILFALVIFRDFHISLVILLMYRDLLIVIIGWFVVKKVEKPIMANMWGKINTSLITVLTLLFLLEFYNYFYTFILYACYLSILISGFSYARISEKVLFIAKKGLFLYRIILFLLTGLVIYLVLQIDQDDFRLVEQKSDSHELKNLQHETSAHIKMIGEVVNYDS